MPAPIKVELVPHSADWARMACEEIARISSAFGASLITVHHTWFESVMPLALDYQRKLHTSPVHPPQLDCGHSAGKVTM